MLEGYLGDLSGHLSGQRDNVRESHGLICDADHHMNVLFENGRALAASDLKSYAEKVGLNLESFAACLATDRPKKIVDGHAQAAREFGVEGTPALFVNGIKLIGLLPLPLMQAIIDRELSAN